MKPKYFGLKLSPIQPPAPLAGTSCQSWRFAPFLFSSITKVKLQKMKTCVSTIRMSLNDRNCLLKKHVFYMHMSNLLTWRGRDLWYISQPASRVRSSCFGFTLRSCHVVHLNIYQHSISARCVKKHQLHLFVACFCCPQMAKRKNQLLSV